MTHEELLKAVKDNPTTMAVVKLHMPEGKFHLIDGELKKYFDAETRCKQCSKSPYTTAYPCPTIQAIKEELK